VDGQCHAPAALPSEIQGLTTRGADTRMETFISHLVHTRLHKKRSRNAGVHTTGYTYYHKVK